MHSNKSTIKSTPRINITLERNVVVMLAKLAKNGQEKKSLAGIARELILEALELREDIDLSKIADSRHGEKTIPYDKIVWK